MKKFLYNIVVTVAFLSLFTLCEKEDDEPVVIETNLVIDKTSFTVSASSAAEVFNVTSNKDWTAKNDAAWITLSPASGKADSKIQVSLTIAENDDTADRTATITVTAEDKTGEVTVKQIGKEIIIIPGIEIADAQFKKYLLENFDSNRDGVISDEEALTVTKIDCSSQEIATLKGIANFVNLDTLICANNKLDSIDISGNKKLKHLDCSTNTLTDIVLSLNEDLKSLNCSNNKLDSLIIAGNQALVSLNCSKNSLKSLDISNNAALDTLICTGNPELESIYFAKDQQVSHLEYDSETTTLVYPEPEKVYVNIPDPKFKEYLLKYFDPDHDGGITTEEAAIVKVLACYDQQISSLEGIEAFVNLEKLVCYSNHLSTIDLSQNKKLTELNCSNNTNVQLLNLAANTELSILTVTNCQMTSLDVKSNTKLTELICPFNKLSVLNVTQCPNLTKLNCNSNTLKTLDVHRNLKLQMLNCTINPELTEIYLEEGQTITLLYKDETAQLVYPNYITFEDDVFSNYLLQLFDDDNNGKISTPEAKIVTELSCVGIGITSLKGIEAFTNLTFLECSGNELTSLNVSTLKSLRVLRCDSNKIQKIDVSQNPELTELSCGKNQLTSLDISNNLNLITLICNNNSLYSLNPEKNIKLETIMCQSNQIGYTLYLQYNLALKVLDCTDNPRLKLIQFKEGHTPATFLYDKNIANIKYLAEEEIEKLVNIDDPIFKQYLIGEGYDTDRDGEISKDEAKRIKNIDCSGLGISSLAGIEYFTELLTLDCSGNHLTSLKLTENTNLTEINCFSNDIAEIDISACTALRSLTCGNNQLTVLNISNNPYLSFLECANNKIKVLNLIDNPSLLEVRCGGNPGLEVYLGAYHSSSIIHHNGNATIYAYTPVMGALKFADPMFQYYLVKNFDTNNDGGLQASEAAVIKEIHCRGLGIKSLAGLNGAGLNVFTSLQILDCSNNAITVADISLVPGLISLNINTNKLTSINVTGCTSLSVLMCAENKLTALDLQTNTGLELFDCYNNLIGPELDLSNNTRLSYVTCDYNKNLIIVWLKKDVMNADIIQMKDSQTEIKFKP